MDAKLLDKKISSAIIVNSNHTDEYYCMLKTTDQEEFLLHNETVDVDFDFAEELDESIMNSILLKKFYDFSDKGV